MKSRRNQPDQNIQKELARGDIKIVKGLRIPRSDWDLPVDAQVYRAQTRLVRKI